MGTPENIGAAYESAMKKILQWDVSAGRGPMIFNRGDRDEINQYLQAVDEIHRQMELTTMSDDDKSKANSVMEIAMARLEEEFVSILIGTRCPKCSVCSSSTSEDSITCELLEEDYFDYIIVPSEEKINDLRSIAQRMDSVQVYRRVRKDIVKECFQSLGPLGIEKLSIQEIWRLEWQVLEVKIKQWIRVAKFCFRIFIPKEKQLCEQIFGDLGTDLCFLEMVQDLAIQLFDFVEAVSTSSSRPSPQKLFKFLDLHKALSELLPDVNALFQLKTGKPIRIRAFEILSRLPEAIRGILAQFENAVCHELSTVLDPSGEIHSFTKYVVSYTVQISNYKESLTSLIVSKPSTKELRLSDDDDQMIDPDVDLAVFERQTPLGLHLIWIIQILVCKLEFKSKLYEDDTLGHLFMMNNVHYIVQGIKDCPELQMMIGDDYLNKLIGKDQQTQSSYSRATWSGILSCLKHHHHHQALGTSGSFSSSFFRKKLKSFNALFDEADRTQATWLIPDMQLREELRVSISEELIPAYSSFLVLFRSHIGSQNYPETCIKYSVDDLQAALLEFFNSKQENLKLRSSYWLNKTFNSESVRNTTKKKNQACCHLTKNHEHKRRLKIFKNLFVCFEACEPQCHLIVFGLIRIGRNTD